MKYFVVILVNIAVLLTVRVDCFDGNSFDEEQTKLLQQLPPELANSNVTVEDVKVIFKEKCKKVSNGDQAFEDIEKGTLVLVECVNDLINITALQSEIDIARPKGELDAVFNKYCQRRSEAMSCARTFKESIDKCLEEDEKKHSIVFMNILQSILNFVCYKGGDQIALFIAEKGPECLEENKDAISNCLNSTFSDYIPKNLSTKNILEQNSLPHFIIGPKQCGEMQDLEHCVVKTLEKCEEITPANIVESLFKFIKNETMCQTSPRVATRSSSSADKVLFASNGLLIILLSSFLLIKVKEIIVI